MNPNENQHNQINRVAQVIQVNDPNKQEVVTTVPVEPVKQEKVKKKKDPVTIIFIIILLLIICFLGYLFIFYLLPNLKGNNEVIDTTTTTTASLGYNIDTLSYSEYSYINFDDLSKVNDDFTIECRGNGINLDIYVNSVKITSADTLITKVGLVDNKIIFVTQNNAERTTKLFVVNIQGEVVYELYDIKDSNGMVLNNDSTSFSFSGKYISFMTSRVNSRNELVTSNEFGFNEGINVCDMETLSNNGITDDDVVIASYTIEYMGDDKFSDPSIKYNVKLSEYKSVNGIC